MAVAMLALMGVDLRHLVTATVTASDAVKPEEAFAYRGRCQRQAWPA